jgi:hypothetical protein
MGEGQHTELGHALLIGRVQALSSKWDKKHRDTSVSFSYAYSM